MEMQVVRILADLRVRLLLMPLPRAGGSAGSSKSDRPGSSSPQHSSKKRRAKDRQLAEIQKLKDVLKAFEQKQQATTSSGSGGPPEVRVARPKAVAEALACRWT